MEWAKQKFLQNRRVTLTRPGLSIDLSQVTPWQGAANLDTTDPCSVNLPTNPVVGDIVDVFTARGGPCTIVFGGEESSIDGGGSSYPFSGEAVYRFTCTNVTGPVWSLESRSMEQWADAVNTTAIGLALQSGGLGAEAVAANSRARAQRSTAFSCL